MNTLNASEMAQVEGGGFWGGLACGAGIMLTVALVLAPEPTGVTKELAYITGVATAGTCGWAIFG